MLVFTPNSLILIRKVYKLPHRMNRICKKCLFKFSVYWNYFTLGKPSHFLFAKKKKTKQNKIPICTHTKITPLFPRQEIAHFFTWWKETTIKQKKDNYMCCWYHPTNPHFSLDKSNRTLLVPFPLFCFG